MMKSRSGATAGRRWSAHHAPGPAAFSGIAYGEGWLLEKIAGITSSVANNSRLGRIDALQRARHTDGMEGSAGAAWLSDRELVDSVLRDLAEAADRWEALVAQAETVTYSVEMRGIRAVANSDGKLVDLFMYDTVTADYSHTELADLLNAAFAALRTEVDQDHQARYGGELV
jgi:hypothetical protein